jgi:hypothetical protein
VQVALCQSRGVARGKFSTPLFTSGLFFGETKYSCNFYKNVNYNISNFMHPYVMDIPSPVTNLEVPT